MKEKVMQGKPYAGNPHVRFDEGAGAPRHSGRSALLYRKQTWRAAISAAAMCMAAAMSSFAEAKSVTLSCAGYTGTTTLTNFQALVKLTEGKGGFSYADSAANGTDLWFTDSSGNVIPHEVDTWNTSGDSFVWVRIPEVVPTSGGLHSVFMMHWGDLAVKQTTSVNVWKNYNDGKGGFSGVWHMGTASGTASEPDATDNGLDAVPTVNFGTGNLAAMTTTPGIVGNGRINQTAEAYVQGLKVPDYSNHVTDASKFTISGWWSATALNTYPRFASAEGATHYWAIVGWNNDRDNINRWEKVSGIYSNGETKDGGSITSAFAINRFQSPNWVYLTVVWDGTTLTAYSNGSQKYQKTDMVAQTALDSGFMIGGDSASASKNPAWRGYYDEVRMYDGVQSADRVKADYDTMSAPDTFLTFLEARETTLRATGYAGTTTLSNFQGLVKVSESAGGFSYAQCASNDGSDLWFTDSSGNVIPHEIDTWNPSGDSLVWVCLPELSPVAQGVTSFTMHWGDAGEKATHSCTTTDTWAGYVGVWHMNGTVVNGTAQNEPDATDNGLDAVPTVNFGTGNLAAMTTTPGIVGNGRINQTAEAYVQGLKVPDYSNHVTDASKFTISGWWSATALNTYPRFASAEGATHYWAIVGWNSDRDNINRWEKVSGIYSNGETKDGGSMTSSFAINRFQSPNWVYLTVVWDGTTLTAYSNGSQKYQKTDMVAQTALDSGFMIGGDSASASKNPAWRGYYDEVRMFDGVVSADRVKADYDTMNAPDTFLTFTTVATWTGAANDGNGANPQNWVCSNNGVAVAGQLPNATYKIQSCTLARDCDWSGLGTAYLADGAIVEMDGHSLTLPVIYGSGMVQNSATGDAKELTLALSSNWINTDVSISGNLKLIKAGAGTFTSSKAQTYTGGTIVSAGTAQPPTRTSASDRTYSWTSFKAFGTGEITVNSNATFDVRGQYGYRNIITLNGGTFTSSGFTGRDDTQTDCPSVKRLTDNSFITVPQSCMFGNSDDEPLDLAGHTLTITIYRPQEAGLYFNSRNSFADNPGTVVFVDNPKGFGPSIPAGSTIWATNVNFHVGSWLLLSENSSLHVHDYIPLNTDNKMFARSGSKLCVYGTFKPNVANNYFCGPEMQDNAAIDLSGMSGPWSNKSGGSNLDVCKYVTFADGARVNIELGSRKVSANEAIMTWDAASKPANLDTLTFKGVFNDRIMSLSKRDDGLYLPRGFMIIVK